MHMSMYEVEHSRDDAHHGNAEAVVEAHDALGSLRGLGKAVRQPVEVALTGTHIGGEASPAIRLDEKNGTRRENEGGGVGNGILGRGGGV